MDDDAEAHSGAHTFHALSGTDGTQLRAASRRRATRPDMSSPVAPHQPWLDLYDRICAWTPTRQANDPVAAALLQELSSLPHGGTLPPLSAMDTARIDGLRQAKALAHGETVKLDAKYVDHPVQGLLGTRDDLVWPVVGPGDGRSRPRRARRGDGPRRSLIMRAPRPDGRAGGLHVRLP